MGSLQEGKIVLCYDHGNRSRFLQLSWPTFTKIVVARDSPGIAVPIWILYETSQNLATSLQKWMSDHNLQESLQALPPMLNHIITKSIRKDLSRQRWNRNPRRLPLQDIAEIFEVRVAPPYTTVAELEGGNIGTTYDLVVGVHAAAHSMCAWILDLYLEEILRWTVDLLKALLARVWHCLHDCGVWWRVACSLWCCL